MTITTDRVSVAVDETNLADTLELLQERAYIRVSLSHLLLDPAVESAYAERLNEIHAALKRQNVITARILSPITSAEPWIEEELRRHP